MTTKSSRQRERASSRKKLMIDDIAFNIGEPTPIPLERLYTWVVWQFPRLRSVTLGGNSTFGDADGVEGDVFTGHSGAVHPGDGEHGWYPALIDAAAGTVLIFANVAEPSPSPEAASKYFD